MEGGDHRDTLRNVGFHGAVGLGNRKKSVYREIGVCIISNPVRFIHVFSLLIS